MKVLSIAIILVAASSQVSADKWISGYTKSNGTYVQGHSRSEPNQYRYDNNGSQSNGGSQRDEYSSGGGAANKSNPNWGSYDNDNDGTSNAYDKTPNKKSSYDW
jgi:hypothetical protein